MLNKKSLIYYTSPNILSSVVFFLILFPLMTKYVTIEEFGIRAIIQLSIIPFEVITAFGASWLVQAYFLDFKDKDERGSFLFTLFSYGLIVRSAFFLLFYFFLHLLFYYLLPWSDTYLIFFHLSLINRLLKTQEVIVFEVLTMDKKAEIFFYYKLAVVLALLFSTYYCLVIQNLGLTGLFYADILASAIGLLFLPYFSVNYFNFKFSFKYLKKKILITGSPAIPKNALGKANKNIIPYLLSIFTSIEILGVYNRSSILNPQFQYLWQSIRRLVSPEYLNYENNNFKIFNQITNSWLMFSTFSIVLICFFYSDFLVFFRSRRRIFNYLIFYSNIIT